MTDIIQTSGGTGAPAYTDDNAPQGGQWNSVNGSPSKIPEGTKVEKTGKANDYTPPYIEINILDGQYAGTKGLWVKSTHVVTVTDPTPPPVDEGLLQVTGIAVDLVPFAVYLKVKPVKPV
ncbi:MAG: hypothetical protein LUQ37_05870 [Methanoregulaceae archaeon]|jgi:hypothetical protein|nr:hypothetical protein [Methanoregulaceae archaeon]